MKSYKDYLAELIAEDQYGGGFGGGGWAPVTDTTSPIHGHEVTEKKKVKDESKRNHRRTKNYRS